MSSARTDNSTIIIANRKAYYDYTVLNTLQCGIALNGSEVKSIRNKNVSFSDAYIRTKQNELLIHNLYIAPYAFSSTSSPPDPLRIRKLLAHKREILKLARAVQQKGNTLIPLNFHTARGNLIKILIGVTVGKKRFDKRNTIRDRDMARDHSREMKKVLL